MRPAGPALPGGRETLVRTRTGLEVWHRNPEHLSKVRKDECPFTYYRPLSTNVSHQGAGAGCPGSQYWEHPPRLDWHTERPVPVSEMADKYARKRPFHVAPWYVVEQRLHQHAAWNSHGQGTGYCDNYRTMAGAADWKNRDDTTDTFRTTYGDLQSTGHIQEMREHLGTPRLIRNGAPAARFGDGEVGGTPRSSPRTSVVDLDRPMRPTSRPSSAYGARPTSARATSAPSNVLRRCRPLTARAGPAW